MNPGYRGCARVSFDVDKVVCLGRYSPFFFDFLLEGELRGGKGFGRDLREEIGGDVFPALGKGSLEDGHLLLQASILNLQVGGFLSLALA